jgi:hypothetical protein
MRELSAQYGYREAWYVVMGSPSMAHIIPYFALIRPDSDRKWHRDLLGLTRAHATLLLDALKEVAVDGEAVSGRLDRYGQRYTIDVVFAGPTGQAMIRSAWIIRPGEAAPRLVTCYIL